MDLCPASDKANNESSEEIDGGLSIDSTKSNNNNTPKSKKLSAKEAKEAVADTVAKETIAVGVPPTNVIYKYFIGQGNNSMMVRGLFKNRFWWCPGDKGESEKCNFCWTQVKTAKIMEAIPAKYPNARSGNSKQAGFKQLLATPTTKGSKKKKLGALTNEKREPPKLTDQKLYNKIEDNFHVNNKKALFINMKNYYEALDQEVFDSLPLTFHVKNTADDKEFQRFK